MIQRYSILNKKGMLIHSGDHESEANENGYWTPSEDVIKAFEPVDIKQASHIVEDEEHSYIVHLKPGYIIVKKLNFKQPKRPGNLSGTDVPNA